jgi:hypothetical protein
VRHGRIRGDGNYRRDVLLLDLGKRSESQIAGPSPRLIASLFVDNIVVKLVDSANNAVTKLPNSPLVYILDKKVDLKDLTGRFEMPLMKNRAVLVVCDNQTWVGCGQDRLDNRWSVTLV